LKHVGVFFRVQPGDQELMMAKKVGDRKREALTEGGERERYLVS
jgi:hypothetical protein